MSSQTSGGETRKVMVENELASGSFNPPVERPPTVAGTNPSPEGVAPVDNAASAFTDEISALKERILALERTASVHSWKTDPTISKGHSHDQLSTEEHQRMERSLHEHRKKWDTYAGQTFQRRYTRAKGAEEEQQGEREIAETELKKSEDLPQNTDVAAAITETGIIPKPEINEEKYGEANKETISHVFAKFEWFLFKRQGMISNDEATQVKEGNVGEVCIIDVLVGDPVIRDDGIHLLYGYSGRSGPPRKLIPRANAVSSDTPGQNLLPERIRVRSSELVAILVKILGPSNAQGLQAKPKSSPVVFVRPFKTLLSCEQALRDWCAALEKKFSTTSPAEVEAPVAELGRGEHSKDTDGSSNTEGVPEFIEKEEQSAIQDSENRGVTIDGINNFNNEHDPKKDRTSKNDGHVKGIGEGDDPKEEKHPGEEQKLEDPEGGEDEEDDPEDITKSRTALSHLKCLLSFADSEILARKAYLNTPECRKIHYSDLWLLFQPGVEVINQDGKQVYRVVEVNSEPHRAVPIWKRYLINPAAAERPQSPFSITCVFIDFDGKHLGPVKRVFHLKPFEGEQDVTSLQTYPLRFFQTRESDFTETEWREIENKGIPRQQQFRKKLIERGAKFLDLVRVKHMYYAGPTLGVQDEIDSQVVVDFETAFTSGADAHKQWKPELSLLLETTTAEDDALKQRSKETCRGACCLEDFVYNDTNLEKKIRTDYIESLLPKEHGEEPSVAIVPRPLKEIDTGSVTENELLIMSYRVFGFVLRSRKWAQLDLSFMSDLHPSDASKPDSENTESGTQPKRPITSFDRLVLEKGHRPMIESLVAQHFRDKESSRGPHEQVDIVIGKGKGLIMLLHGAPGVGKTSTAEGVAELFRKPLFQITCGDLGTTAREVEQALETNFALASRWDCILLLDEADVFLASRTKEDFIRNGLVAAFLRVMEYYSGILFLTTNRVGDFDEAFTSRIHVSLYYPELNEEKTVGVFKINMEMIEDRFALKARRIVIDKMGIGSFASKHFSDHRHARWNGRQIRNACQTALALAEFEAQGNSHESILKPDAVVELGVEHFETVQKAYLEFAKYMHDLYGTYASRRAKEERLRAIWIDENDKVVATHGMGGSTRDKMRSAFVLGSQLHAYPGYQPPTTHRQQQDATAFGQVPPHTQQQSPEYQQPSYQQYQGIPTTLPPMGYTPSSAPGIDTRLPVQGDQFHNYTHTQARWVASPTAGTAIGPMNTNNTEPGPILIQPGQQHHQTPRPQTGQPFVGGDIWGQPAPPQPPQGQQDQQRPPPTLLSQGVQAMYAASRQPGSQYLG